MMIPAWARVGAKVVFIDGRPPMETSLVVGKIYTITAISRSTCIDGPHRGERGISVEEYPGLFWTIPRFRPIVTRTQSEDVAQFLSLLDSIDA